MNQSIEISVSISQFLDTIEEGVAQGRLKKTEEAPERFEEAGQIAFWYEKIRMAIDYKEDHLLRRNATRRILKRLFILESRRNDVVDLLLKELIMGGYVKKSDLNKEKFIKVNQALNKYALAITLIYKNRDFAGEKGSQARRWLLTLASSEIEEILYPTPERRALINAMYRLLAPRIDTAGYNVSEKQKNLQTYIAIYRSLAKADRAMVTSEIFRQYFPDWFERPSKQRIKEIVNHSFDIMRVIHPQATSNLASRIFYAIKKQTLYAHIIYEIAMENLADARGIISQEYLLREFVKKKMDETYERTEGKLKKRIARGIIYIFLTKMLLAVLIEIPFEKYVVGAMNYVALAINILVPPTFMVILAKSARLPGEENTEAIVKGVENLVYDDPWKDEIGKISVYPLASSGFSQKTLDVLYILVFSLVFGVLIGILLYFNFDYVSGPIFIIFMATVSFFGALIRQSIRDLVVIKEKEGVFSLLFDTMLLPFVRFGRFLSTNFSKINVFMFFLDVIVEAPFKMLIRLLESWISFLKKKREEVDQQFG